MTPTTPPITRITRVLAGVTSIFRCHGLHAVPSNADNLGGHDLVYWCGFLALMTAWFLFVYMPQCRKGEMLAGRQDALALQLDTDKKELVRLQRGIVSLKSGDSMAWERAARERMGWLEPGEITDVERWRQTHPQFGARPVYSRPAAPLNAQPRLRSAPPADGISPPPSQQRPAVPRLPRLPQPPTGVAGRDSPAFRAIAGEPPLSPPPLPPLPPQPLHPSYSAAPRVALARNRN
jgi:hypothetical protein